MTSAQRKELRALMDYCVAHRGAIHYPPGDVRRERVSSIRSWVDIHARVTRPGGWTVDCSQMCEALLRAVGAYLPFAEGTTESFLDHCKHYSDGRAAYVGACGVWGLGHGHHMAMVYERDTKNGNPLMFSHGQESDPRLIHAATESAFQPHPLTYCSVASF